MRLDEVPAEIANIEVFEQQRFGQRAEIVLKAFEYLQDEKRIDADLAKRRFRIEYERRIRRLANQRLEISFGALL